ncbi:DUF2637 domain-containing protein [Streptomyces sp. RM99]|uniref:DUF2637 domain-containing protein n=2 Tax=Streptomyces TaxID=1883 RepID=UPI001B384EEA|nr:DUF2637 domain-containing protein [Streptomyces sp. RM99]MBQ0915674.1 DUF2637 domain-containing protein [Streptomyces sp. RM99]
MPVRTTASPVPMMTAAIRLGVALVGTIGFALSYDALRQMAVAIHIRGVLTYAFPLVIDGFIAIGVAALLILRAAPWRSRLYVWALVGIATITSIWANALHAVRLNQESDAAGLHLDDVTVGALSAIAPLALAGAVHLDLVIRRHPTGRHSTEPVSAQRHTHVENVLRPAPDSDTADASKGAAQARHEVVAEDIADVADPPAEVAAARQPHSPIKGRQPSASTETLLALGRAAPLGRQGRISRRHVEAAIRAQGHPVGKDRLTEITRRLQAELDRTPERAS